MEVVGEAGDGHQAVLETQRLKPDIVLMDLNMPVMSGLQALQRIQDVAPDIKVIMLTISDKSDDLMSAIEKGAHGYLLKSMDSQSFITALRGLEQGEHPISGKMTAALMARVAQRSKPAAPPPEPKPTLTDREIELLQLIARGLPNKAIGEELKISENTVKYHLKHIVQKLNLKNRAEAAAYAVQSGIVPPKD